MRNYIAILSVAALLGACDSPLDVNPTAQIDAGTALTTTRGIELALNGAYRSLTPSSLYGVNQMVYPDLYADNLDFTGTFQTDREVALRNITTGNTAVLGLWAAAFDGINRANSVLAAVDAIPDMTDAAKNAARGEALFIRALQYSILAAYFGGVPLTTEPAVGVGE